MFTGGFEKISRSEAKTITENLGGKVLGSISKKLDILVVGSSKPTKKKIETNSDGQKKTRCQIRQSTGNTEWLIIASAG